MKPGSYWASRLDNAPKVPPPYKFRRDGSTRHFDINWGIWAKGKFAVEIEAARESILDVIGGDSCRDSLIGDPPHRDRHTLTSLHFAFVLHEIAQRLTPAAILEIGGGFGGFAIAAIKKWPSVRFGLADFHPMVKLQHWYHNAIIGTGCSDLWLFEAESIEKTLFRRMDALRFDAIVNMTSFCEMEVSDVNAYLEMASHRLIEGGLFVSVNHKQCVNNFADWDIPTVLRCVKDEPFIHLPHYRGDLMIFERRN